MTPTHPSTYGKLIVFEGIDGTGKSTQIKGLADYLTGHGYSVTLLREPTDGPHGRRIRQLATAGLDGISAEEECELFRLDRVEDVARNIRPALERGDIVLLDRYYFSTMAYQGARGLDMDQIRRANEAFAPIPDRVLYLDLAPEASIERIRSGRGETPNLFERREFLETVRANYQSFGGDGWIPIDASRSREEVLREIIQALEASDLWTAPSLDAK